MLQLILGGAGSGKSAHLTDLIASDVAAGRPAWLIIPEQQANLTERTILPRLPAAAGLTFRVAGFTRLSQEVASRYGGVTVTTPSAGVSALLMWDNLRQLQGLLQEYHTASPRSDAHLTGLLLQTVNELRATSVTPTQLEYAAARLPEGSALRPKLYDLALLYATYENALLSACGGETTDPLLRLATQLEQNDYFAGGNVYIDAFTSFTGEEYAVLRAMLRSAARVTITLTTDEHLAKTPAQDSPEDTRRRLLRLCNDLGVPVHTQTLIGNRRTNAPELQALERSLWDLSLREDNLPDIPKDARGAILPLRCTNLYAEAEATALHILDEVASGTRFGNIAIIVRDTEAYRGVLDAALEHYHIPFYFSEKTALSDKPLSRLLLSALRAVCRGFEVGDIMTLLKTGLCPVDPKQADLFEQYIDTWKITGAAFTAPNWTRNPDGYGNGGRISPRGAEILTAANTVREAIMTPLLRLHAAVSGERTMREMCEALYRLMLEFGLSDRIRTRAEEELSAGYLKEAGETLRVYDTVLSVLTEMSRDLPDSTLDAEAFTTALSIVFNATEIASVPSLHDSVIIGGADTLRVENIGVSFLLGLNEGEFPKAVSDEGLLGDAEKRQLLELGIELDGRAEQLSSNELLFVFRAMTKPATRLYVSTQLSSTDGKTKSPSVAYHRLFFLFPYLKDTTRTFDLSLLAEPAPTAEVQEPEISAETEDDGLYTPQEPSKNDLPQTLLSRFYDHTLWLTQSRIQAFVQCPYSFYCTYMLSPRTREPARIDADDSGTFMHYLLEQFLRRCLDQEGKLHLPASEDISPIAESLVNGYLSRMSDISVQDYRTLHTFRRLKALTVILLADIVKELTHSRFTPCALELRIDGRTPNTPAPYEIPLSDGRRILLGGTVDRVDFYRRGDEIFLRVIDYKSSSHDISISEVKRGLGLQLLIYLFALCRPENIHPAGALYVATTTEDGKPLADRSGLLLNDYDVLTAMNDTLDATYLAGISQKKDGSLKGSALTDAEALSALETELQETLRRIGEDMLQGRARRTPSPDACQYCCVREGCPDACPPKRSNF